MDGFRGGSSRFTDLLLSTVNSLDSAARIRESLAYAYWARVAGPQAAAATEVEAVRDGVLFIRTRSSVWSHELTLHKERLVQGLNRMLGGPFIKEIVYRARGVEKHETAPPEPDAPGVKELEEVVLEPAEQADLQEKLFRLETIPSDRVRKVMSVRLTQEMKLRHWRIERGWRLCERCAALHKTRFSVCPICRLCS